MAIISAAFSRFVLSGWYGDPIVQRIKAVSGTNATLVAGRPANVSSIVLCNHAASERFLKLFDKASAPVVGTDIPLFTLPIEQSVSPLVISIPAGGIPFASGLGFAITGGVADSDTTSVSADDLHGFLTWSAYS